MAIVASKGIHKEVSASGQNFKKRDFGDEAAGDRSMVLKGFLALNTKQAFHMADSTIESILQEQRVFEPSESFSAAARIPEHGSVSEAV